MAEQLILPHVLPAHLTKDTPGAKYMAVHDAETNQRLTHVTAVHLEEGWIEELPVVPTESGTLKLKIENGKIAPPIRRQCNFYIKDRRNGDILFPYKKSA